MLLFYISIYTLISHIKYVIILLQANYIYFIYKRKITNECYDINI